MQAPAQYITIGKIVNTHGNRGLVRVLPLTDFPERFMNMNDVTLLHNGLRKEYHIEKAGTHKHFVIIKFREVMNMDAAQALKGALLQVRREQLVKLPENTYYIFDIIGLQVYTPEHEYIGQIQDVLQTGANDVYVTKMSDGRTALIPALKTVITKVDLLEKKMIVKLPQGLLEETGGTDAN